MEKCPLYVNSYTLNIFSYCIGFKPAFCCWGEWVHFTCILQFRLIKNLKSLYKRYIGDGVILIDFFFFEINLT